MTGFQQHKRVSRALAAGVCAAALVAIPGRAEAQNAAFEWNQIAAQLIVVGSQSPVQQTRLMAIVHVAMHDAVSGITGGFEQYIPAAPGPAAVSPQAAAIGAAHRALQGAVGPSMFLETSFMQSLGGSLEAKPTHSSPGSGVACCAKKRCSVPSAAPR